MIKLSTILATSLTLGLSFSATAGTLDDVKTRGTLSCGVSTGLAGFSQKDEKGQWSGLDVDSCKAVAAAVLGDANKVQYKPLTAKERFTALQSGEIDILARNTTWTITRDASLGLNFAGVNYYDGQGFMVQSSLGVKSVLELNGASFCIQAGTTTELNLADYFRSKNMTYKVITFDSSDQTRAGFESGRCDALTSDQSQLYAIRIGLKNPSGAIVLPEVISKEPLGPVVRQGDDEWFNVVRWSLIAMIEAEYLGVTSTNVDAKMKSGNPAQKRLLGTEGDAGSSLKLSADWAYMIVKQVGNYGESFDRNVGKDSPLQIARGQNAQWTRGGLMYSAPIR
ncbi:amino acid ABC transporter substrate-binding protein [Marinicellulosiphila megalodicopiae]|uniref:amino acid ABC transporter substrate-binding protein n=1 Tax=Marinicellulosiphila megalodicopiae TaxID=2724896 RepID=UPI003BB1EC19